MDANEALTDSAEAAASLREAGWKRDADVMDALAAEVERLRAERDDWVDAFQRYNYDLANQLRREHLAARAAGGERDES